MSSRFTVSMLTRGATVPSNQIKQKEPTGNVQSFDNESEALQLAMANKDYYATVVVKNDRGDILLEYHDGSKV